MVMPAHMSVHDNIIYAYVVNCEHRRLVLHTVYAITLPQYTDVIFTDVLAHHFEHVLPGNIIFDIQEVDTGYVVSSHAALFKLSWRYGWPPIEYEGDLQRLLSSLKQKSI